MNSELLCINTYRGLYKFERLQLGVKVTPAIFQQVAETMLSELDFAFAYLDDILVKSKSIIGHKEHVNKFLQRFKIMDLNLKRLNMIFFFLEKIKYLDHTMDKDGRRPDSERAATIKDMR